ncbi:subtilisin-like protein [Xylaria scruposa]|nr:subtilisin-like protein [Xylaria scruposa]
MFTIMDEGVSQGELLKYALGVLAQKRPTKTARPARLKSRTEAWLRADAFLQHESGDFDDDSEHTASTLRAIEHYLQPESDEEEDDDDDTHDSLPHDELYRAFQAMRKKKQGPTRDPHANTDSSFRPSKRKRENEACDLIEQISHLSRDTNKRRVVTHDEPISGHNTADSNADLAVLMRRHLSSLDKALRNNWVCVCHKCSGLSVRLLLPQQMKGSTVETSFEVFFGVRNVLTTTLQEAKITVKDVHDQRLRSASVPEFRDAPEFAHICNTITESLGQRNRLHFALEGGTFQRLRPQPKAFGGDVMSWTVSLSALFDRQQGLQGGTSVLPLKGKRVLAVTLASALLPFLETSWLQPSFNHSKIQFFEPIGDAELPDITKPFLAMEHIPGGKTDTGASPDNDKDRIHPNLSVMKLGILLCELQYCTPVERMQKDRNAPRNVNTDFYTCVELLKNLEADAGVDYYLATKACLYFEYLPNGQEVPFDSVSVQRLFYQNVVKRLEAEIFKVWSLRLENLSSLDPKQNESCWGVIAREVVRRQTGRTDSSEGGSEVRQSPFRSMSDGVTASYAALNPNVVPQMPAQPSPHAQPHANVGDLSGRSLRFFDASYQTGSAQDRHLSDQWMLKLLSSIHPFVATYETEDPGRRTFEPVRIAILDSGFDPENPLLWTDMGKLDPRIKAAQSFVHQTESDAIRDEIGHGTHALGLLLNIAICAEIYIAKVAHQETLDRNAYDDIAKAINHAVNEWNVDIISMSFGIREHSEPIKNAISNASNNKTLLFAAASNDGGNFGRAFPAKYPSVFCIHSTDGQGNPSTFNPTAHEKDINFSLLGEHVSSHWPIGKKGHNDNVNILSGTSIATPIAAGLAALVLSFVRQQERYNTQEANQLLAPWLKYHQSMDLVFQKMVKRRREYDYITPQYLFDDRLTHAEIYDQIKDIKRRMYD